MFRCAMQVTAAKDVELGLYRPPSSLDLYLSTEIEGWRETVVAIEAAFRSGYMGHGRSTRDGGQELRPLDE